MTRDVILRPWEEVTGECGGIAICDGIVTLTISEVRLKFSSDSPEGQAITAAIDSGIITSGAHLALLRTEIPGRLLLIRALNGEHGT